MDVGGGVVVGRVSVGGGVGIDANVGSGVGRKTPGVGANDMLVTAWTMAVLTRRERAVNFIVQSSSGLLWWSLSR